MDVNFEVAFLAASRAKLLQLMEGLTDEQLFRIPPGFNNNIIWHLGHCVTAQQRLMYLRSKLPMHISDQYADFFKIGTSPAGWAIQPDKNEVRESLIGTVERLNEDIANNLFRQYEAMKTSAGIMLTNHVEALAYANFHEAEHTGNMMYLKRVMGI